LTRFDERGSVVLKNKTKNAEMSQMTPSNESLEESAFGDIAHEPHVGKKRKKHLSHRGKR